MNTREEIEHKKAELQEQIAQLDSKLETRINGWEVRTHGEYLYIYDGRLEERWVDTSKPKKPFNLKIRTIDLQKIAEWVESL